MRITIGTILIILGAYGIYLSTDWELTEYEWLIKTISLLLIMSGIFTIIYAILKNKSYNKLQQLSNEQNVGYLKNQCPNCKLNVVENTEICPRCNYKLKQEQGR